MKIKKIKIKNLFGIKEYEADGKSVELSGQNGVGKTSVIDAIRYALTNKSNRDYIIRNGETEGEIIIETDSGLSINRRPRTTQTDYKSIKKNGKEVTSPERFLREIFTELQLNPVEFLAMDKKEQNRIILDMIEFEWDLNWIKKQFGEIPEGIDWEQNILQILHDIQAEDGVYFKTRQDVNRDIRNKRAFVEDIAQDLPPSYNATTWEEANIGQIYQQIEGIRNHNELVEKAKRLIENRDNKVRKFEADREIAKTALENEINGTKNRLEKDILRLEEQIKAHKTEIAGLEEKKQDKLEVIEKSYKADVSKYDAEVEEYKVYASLEVKDVASLLEKAEHTEAMKSHLNEHRRMVDLEGEITELKESSELLTFKIERARSLPGEILETATIPVEGLTVVNGLPLINGLPISNLSEGEKLDLCIDVAVQKPNSLQIVLIDGIEKLSSKNREMLYAKCKTKGLQFIATRTTDDDSLSVVEL